jgi:glycerate 2-kinase
VGSNYKQNVTEIFNAALAAAQPARLLPQYIQMTADTVVICGHAIEKSTVTKLTIISAGKAAAAMAQSAESILGCFIAAGLCITKYNHALPLQYCSVIEAAHPVPDANSCRASGEVLKMLKDSQENDIVLVLLSGGASALMADVPDGCTLADLQHTFDLLVNSGASIREMNVVRKHLSSIKGGQLAKTAQPARVFTLVLSDVVGDDLSTIASGPTVADKSTFADVHEILLHHHVWSQVPVSVKNHIQKGLDKKIADTPNADAAFFKNTCTQIIGNNRMALQAAAVYAISLGYHTSVENSSVQDDAAVFAEKLIGEYAHYKGTVPACFLFGGETTVKVNGKGRGGRNQHLALLLLQGLSQQPHLQHPVTVLSAGTDGTDGNTDMAGAIISSLDTAHTATMAQYLAAFNTYEYFQENGGHFYTGATQTNVMDIVILLIH